VTQPWAGDDTERLSAAEQVLEAPDAEKVFLDLGEAGRATVVRSKAEDRAVIVTEDMVPAPEGRVYELWFQSPEDGSMIPAGLMPEGEDQTVLLEGSANEATAVGITVEPEGGSDEPSTPPIAVFDLTEAT
jgi:anti-sigma-K factor RskA